jgi:hypothetical protein
MRSRGVLAVLIAAAASAASIDCGALLPSIGDDSEPTPDNDASGGGRADATTADGAVDPTDGGSDGCNDCEPRRIVTGQSPISSLAVDATDVYFATYVPANFFKVPIAGGAPTMFITANLNLAATQIVVQGSDVLLSQFLDPGVRRNPKANTTSNIVHGCANNYSIVAGATGFYAASGCAQDQLISVFRFDFGTGEGPAAVSSGDEKRPDGGVEDLYGYSKFGYLALDPQWVYWSNAHAVMRLQRTFQSGAWPEPLFTEPGLILNLVVDNGTIYVRTRQDVRTHPASPGGSANVFVSTTNHDDADYPRLPLAVDADYVYWSDRDQYQIFRLKKIAAGSQPELFVTTTYSPTVILLDGDYVYWATYSGEIWRKHK